MCFLFSCTKIGFIYCRRWDGWRKWVLDSGNIFYSTCQMINYAKKCVCVCGFTHLCQPQCSDRGTSQMPDGSGLFSGVRVWNFFPLLGLHAPCCSRLPLLCLCDHAQTCCGPGRRRSVSLDCCHWWSKRGRERNHRGMEGEREMQGEVFPLNVRLVFHLYNGITDMYRGVYMGLTGVCFYESPQRIFFL